MSKEKTEDVSIEFSPIAGIAVLSACVVCGLGWIVYALAMLLVSSLIGYYVEEKINDLDRITREKAKEATGNEQPGDAKELGELVRKTNQTLGVFCPVIPVVSLCFGWYMGYKASRLAEVGAAKSENRKPKIVVPEMFAAEGRFVF